jgi:hypothetical protein
VVHDFTMDGPIVLRSPNDNYRLRLELENDGSLLATLLIRDPKDPGRWEPQGSGQGQKCLAKAERSHQIDSRIINLR